MQKIKKIINAVFNRLSALILFTIAYILISLLIIFNPEGAMRKFVVLGKASSKVLHETKRKKNV